MTDYVSRKQADSIVALNDGDEMSQFLVGFLGAMLWTAGDMGLGSRNDSEDTPMDANWSICDIDHDDQLAIALKIRPFYLLFSPDWNDIDYYDEQAGHDLALEMSGTGVGFSDRDALGSMGKSLSDAVDKMFSHYNSFDCHGDFENEVAHCAIC